MNETLKKLGFGEKEIAVYLAILEYGKALPAAIAKVTGIKRPTVYAIVTDLIKKGLISEDLAGKSTYLVALPPDRLVSMVERESAKIKERKKLAEEASIELSKLSSKLKYSVPKIKFIEEDDLSDYLHKQHDTWAESTKKYDSTWWGYHDSSLTKAYGKWINWSWEQPVSKNIKVKFFSNEDVAEKEMNKGHEERETKPLPSGNEFDSSMWIVGDYTVMVQTRNRPHYLVEINDQVFARNQRELFKSLWDLSK